MQTARLVAFIALWQLLTTPDTAFGQPIQVAGTLDRSFNPNGYWIKADGSSIPGGYAGSIIIDLGGDDDGESITAFQSNGGRILIGGHTNTGPGSPKANFALVALTETGALDKSFNPSGYWISSTGAYIIPPAGFGYPGSIIIDLGGADYAYSVASYSFQMDGQRILIGGASFDVAANSNFAIVALTETGELDRSFNPNGFWIASDGSSVTGGYAGSIIIDLGGDDLGYAINSYSFQSIGKRIIIGGRTTTGPGFPGLNFAVVVLTQTGALDRSFNPNGDWITSNGSSITQKSYSGSIIIDLGGIDIGRSVATFQSDGERILIGGFTTTGPITVAYGANFALVALTQTGSLDGSFNPSGFWITATGTSIPGGYPGSIIIDLGGVSIGNSIVTFQSDGERTVIGGTTTAGPGGPLGTNFALVALTQAGVLDSSFNPNGYWVISDGSFITGGYPGSIIIDLGGNADLGQSVATFQSDGQRILIGGFTETGPNPFNFALVALTETGSLDRSFNPFGCWITQSGTSITGGYPGSIVIDLGGNDFGRAVATFVSDGTRVLIGGYTDIGPAANENFALVVLNGETIFPPPVTGISDPFLQALIRKYSGLCAMAALE